MKQQIKIIAVKSAPEQIARMVETIYGCKWSITVYWLIKKGINRPGEMVRSVEGLTTKVLNQCLRKNIAFGILSRKTFGESPPRVEYELTPFGVKFVRILDNLERLQADLIIENEKI
jgi:DNA-binding HxlR family transcriptional regulator